MANQRTTRSNASTASAVPAAAVGLRERQFASLLWRRGALGRSEIHQLTGVHPTLTGNAVATLIDAGLVRNGTPQSTPERGRPQIPVLIDPERRVFLGLSLSPGEVRLARLDPLGQPRQREIVRRVGARAAAGGKFVTLAANMLAEALDPAVFAIGMTVTGVVDPAAEALLFSSAMPSASPVSLRPIFQAAGQVPLLLDNDLHALSVRWLMTSDATDGEVLLVGLDDGRLGASVLIDGRPQRGSVTAANELGHMRLTVQTARCYCGQIGCLERIFSSDQLHRAGGRANRSLDEALAEAGQAARPPLDGADTRTAPESRERRAVESILDLLVTGLTNAVNFIRPARLVIASPLARHAFFRDYLEQHLPERILPGIRSRVGLSFWQQPYVQSAENAAWLALADVFGHPPELAER